MGVYAYTDLVKTINGKVEKIEPADMPEVQPIYFLNDLFYLDELKESLLIMLDENIDFSFFMKPNSSAYGNSENDNLSFTSKEVLNLINKITNAFEKYSEKFIREMDYEGAFDEKGNKLHMVFMEEIEGGFFKKKKTYKWGTISANGGNLTLQIFNEEKQCWDKRIDLTIEKPTLFNAEMDSTGKKIMKEKVDWKIMGNKFFDKIKPELDNLKELANYASKNDLELQMVHS